MTLHDVQVHWCGGTCDGYLEGVEIDEKGPLAYLDRHGQLEVTQSGP